MIWDHIKGMFGGSKQIALTENERAQSIRDTPADQEVHLHLRYHADPSGFPDTGMLNRMYELEDKIEAAVIVAGVGAVGGHEVGGNEYIVFAFGPNADDLLDHILPVLKTRTIDPGSFALKRYGGIEDDDAREVRIDLV